MASKTTTVTAKCQILALSASISRTFMPNKEDARLIGMKNVASHVTVVLQHNTDTGGSDTYGEWLRGFHLSRP